MCSSSGERLTLFPPYPKPNQEPLHDLAAQAASFNKGMHPTRDTMLVMFNQEP